MTTVPVDRERRIRRCHRSEVGRLVTLAMSLSAALIVLSCSSGKMHDDSTSAAAEGESRAIDTDNLDPSVDPCDDFYAYANGGWLRRNPIPADRSRWSSYDEARGRTTIVLRGILEQAARDHSGEEGSIRGQLGRVYASCMDIESAERQGVRPLEPELENLRLMTVPADAQEAIARLMHRGVGAPFWLIAAADPDDSSTMVAHLWQNGFVLPGPEDYLDDGVDAKRLLKSYRGYAEILFHLAGRTSEEARRDATQAIEMETLLARVSMTRLQMRDPRSTNNRMSLDELGRLMPHFDWPAFLLRMNTPSVTEVIVGQSEFLRAVDGMLAETPISHWSSYLRWRLLQAAGDLLDSSFFEAHFGFWSQLSGAVAPAPRWRHCLDATNDLLGQALGRLYAKQAFPPVARTRAEAIIGNLKAVLESRIEKLDWMEPTTRGEALAKLRRLEAEIGYPRSIPDYSSLQVDGGSFIENVAIVSGFEFTRELSHIGKLVDSSEWETVPQSISGAYIPSRNRLIYPAAKFQPPFFDAEADDAVNYGAIGATIGHEIAHGFDDEGRQYDSQGNLRDWWVPQDAERFKARAALLIEQFNGYSALPGVPVDGELTLGENIADLGGVTLAYHALQRALRDRPPPGKIDGFTPEQRYFLSWAQNWRANIRPERARVLARTDVHAPTRWRTNGPLSMMNEFAEAFGCRSVDRMVTGDRRRVRIW